MGCHTAIVNPPGYAMENYDAIGAWQTVDRSAARLTRVATATSTSATATTKQITIAQELMPEIAGTPKARRLTPRPGLLRLRTGSEPE